MIILDFKNVEPWSCSLGEDPNKWTDEIYLGKFLGNQIFRVDGRDFGGDYPILGFARQLNEIALRLSNHGSSGVYQDPEWESPIFIEFSLHQDSAVFTAKDKLDNSSLFSATAPLEDLVISSEAYLVRVSQFCSQLCPQIAENAQIQQWLTDFNIPSYRHTL